MRLKALLYSLLLLGFLSKIPVGFAKPSEQQLPKGQMPTLGRPTNPDDPLPTFDFERYFPGTWEFEWDVPESPLGPAGRLTGKEIYQPGIDGRYYESRIEAEAPSGPYTVHSKIVYHPDNKVVARHDSDSRGFSMLSAGSIGGDLGGYYTIYYESGPFEYKGRTIRLRTTTMLVSPVNYRVRASISVDGDKFVNFGMPGWRKQIPGVGYVRPSAPGSASPDGIKRLFQSPSLYPSLMRAIVQ
jgi:hypothetical protein